MAAIYSLKGTSNVSFSIGKRGVTLYQSDAAPSISTGSNGDLYIQRGESPSLYQKIDDQWIELLSASGLIGDLVNLTPIDNNFIGTTGTNLVLRTPAESRTAMGLGSSAVLDVGINEGNVPLLGPSGKLADSVLPDLAISKVNVVDTLSERDNLDAQEGDIAIVTEDGMTYIYGSGSWIDLGYMGVVQAIQGPSGVKSGVVSLDASDILTGILSVARGGTGLGSINQGSIIFGDSDSFSELTIGTTGYQLVSDGVNPTWAKAQAANIEYMDHERLDFTNLQDAIDSLANRSRVETHISDPTAFDDEDSDYVIGDIWINTIKKSTFLAISVDADNAFWAELSTSIKPDGIWFVGNGSNTNPGSFGRPLSSIDAAISRANIDDTIIVLPGTYADTTVSKSVKIIGWSHPIVNVFEITANNVEITGFKSNVTAGIYAYDVTGLNAIIDDAIVVSSSNENVTLNVTGSVKIKNSNIIGKVRVNSNQITSLLLSNSRNCGFNILQGNVRIESSNDLNVINHSSGHLYILNSNFTLGLLDVIISDAEENEDNSIDLFNVDIGMSGNLNFTTGLAYSITNVKRDQNQILSDIGRTYHSQARDIGVSFTPTNYVTATNVEDHLKNIDTALMDIANYVEFKELDDVLPYVTIDANRVVQVNNTGTGITYGPVLGSAATSNISDFASAAQGILASTALQPGDLANVATEGTFVSLTDTPSSIVPADSLKLVRVNSAGNAIEFGVPLSLVGSSGQYSDLLGKPNFGNAALLDAGISPGNVPRLDINGKLELSVLPEELASSNYNIHLVTSGNYTANQNDQIIVVKKVANETTLITLPGLTITDAGKWISVKDGKGNAESYNITIQGDSGTLIDDNNSKKIDYNFESLTFVWNGSEWMII